eukprot:354792-Chlamydomonas_euryale.AAC.6
MTGKDGKSHLRSTAMHAAPELCFRPECILRRAQGRPWPNPCERSTGTPPFSIEAVPLTPCRGPAGYLPALTARGFESLTEATAAGLSCRRPTAEGRWGTGTVSTPRSFTRCSTPCSPLRGTFTFKPRRLSTAPQPPCVVAPAESPEAFARPLSPRRDWGCAAPPWARADLNPRARPLPLLPRSAPTHPQQRQSALWQGRSRNSRKAQLSAVPHTAPARSCPAMQTRSRAAARPAFAADRAVRPGPLGRRRGGGRSRALTVRTWPGVFGVNGRLLRSCDELFRHARSPATPFFPMRINLRRRRLRRRAAPSDGCVATPLFAVPAHRRLTRRGGGALPAGRGPMTLPPPTLPRSKSSVLQPRSSNLAAPALPSRPA